MHKLFNIGDILYGFCDGFFGRDDYDTKLCVTVTSKYAVFQYTDGEYLGNATVLNNPDRLSSELITEWKQEFKEL